MAFNKLTNIFFLTATNLNWQQALAAEERKQLIVDTLKFLVSDKRIVVFGFVIMPNHIHLLLQNNIEDDEKFKMLTQGSLLKFTGKKIVLMMSNDEKKNYYVNAKDRTFQVWERNPLWIQCMTMEMAEQKLNYIHENPCSDKWKLAQKPEEYYFSSAGFYENGIDNFEFITSLYE